MGGLIIQFHATLDELRVFAAVVAARFPIFVTAFRSQPFDANRVTVDELEAVLSDVKVKKLAFTLEEARLPAAIEGEFLDLNPNALLLRIGRLSREGLEESILSARSVEAAPFVTWKRVAQELRKITRTGAVAVNPVTGESSPAKDLRFTKGARQLFDEGVTLRPLAGSCVYRLTR